MTFYFRFDTFNKVSHGVGLVFIAANRNLANTQNSQGLKNLNLIWIRPKFHFVKYIILKNCLKQLIMSVIDFTKFGKTVVKCVWKYWKICSIAFQVLLYSSYQFCVKSVSNNTDNSRLCKTFVLLFFKEPLLSSYSLSKGRFVIENTMWKKYFWGFEWWIPFLVSVSPS